MPQTGLKATRELAIRLDDSLTSYCPGDTIIGAVVRNVHTVSTRAWVTIKLHGRAKSKITVHRSNGNGGSTTKHYRGRFHFFTLDETRQMLFDGPVHIPPGGDPQVWSFALAIPRRPSPGAVKQGNSQDRSYLPLNDEAIATGSLPSSFTFDNQSWRSNFHGFVEYYLEAVFRQENDSHLTTAILPIILRPDSIPYPLPTNLKSRIHPGHVKTHRLIPGMENAELSFHQKTQKFFGSSKVPQFSFTVYVDSPTVIQMQNDIPIPFKVRIVPNRERTSDIIADVPQTIMLTSLTMELKATTLVICDGTFSPHTASGTKEYNFAAKGTILGLRDRITVPSDLEAKALDVGAFVGLSLDTQCAKSRGKPLYQFGKLYPSFITYNIKHSHQLSWELNLEVAGETTKVCGQHPVSILAESEKKDAFS